MKNIDTEQLRKDAEALRQAAFNALSEDHRRALSGQGRELLLLFCAARIVSGMQDAQPDAVDVIIERAREHLKWSEKGFARLSQTKRAAITAAVSVMIADHQPMPPLPKRGPIGACLIDLSETREARTYEVLVGNGETGWHEATMSKRKSWDFLAYPGSVTAVRVPAEDIHRWVTSALDRYSASLPAVGEEAAHAEVRSSIRSRVDWLFHGAALEVDAERSESWWRVHDAVHGGFLRFYIHLDVDGPDIPAAA
jgi:hypothetical protein